MQSAVEDAGFKATPPPGYWFEDTTPITGDAKSFGLFSERANQKVIFIINDDVTPCKNLVNFTVKPPYVTVPGGGDPKVIEEQHQPFGEEGDFHYYAMRYGFGGDATISLIGSFPPSIRKNA